jgi:Ca2+-binding EF-hand superfamily protein
MGNALNKARKAIRGQTYEEAKAQERAEARGRAARGDHVPVGSTAAAQRVDGSSADVGDKEENEIAWATHFSTSDVARLHAAFNDRAKESDDPNRIQREQFRAVLSEAGLDEVSAKGSKHLERLFEVFDVDHSGAIDFREWVTALSVLSKGSHAEKFKLSFEVYDREGNGSISEAELVEALTALDARSQALGADGTEDADRMDEADEANRTRRAKRVKELVMNVFEGADKTKNGRLTYPEYFTACMKNPWLVTFESPTEA